MGGSKGRMAGFAEFIAREIGHPDQKREQLDISKTDRFAFFKIGPVLSISVSVFFTNVQPYILNFKLFFNHTF